MVQSEDRTWIRKMGWLFAAVAIILGSFSVWLLLDARQFSATASHVEGVVSRLEWNPRGPGETSATAYAFIQFVDQDRTVEVRSRTASFPPAYSVGDKVVVLYQPGQAQQARIEVFWEQYLLPIISGALAIVFGAVAATILICLHQGYNKE